MCPFTYLPNTYQNLMHVFFEKLDIMGKPKDIKRYFKLTQSKLLGITTDLVKLDENKIGPYFW